MGRDWLRCIPPIDLQTAPWPDTLTRMLMRSTMKPRHHPYAPHKTTVILTQLHTWMRLVRASGALPPGPDPSWHRSDTGGAYVSGAAQGDWGGGMQRSPSLTRAPLGRMALQNDPSLGGGMVVETPRLEMRPSPPQPKGPGNDCGVTPILLRPMCVWWVGGGHAAAILHSMAPPEHVMDMHAPSPVTTCCFRHLRR